MRRMRERLRAVDYVAWRFGYTPWERHLAECQTRFGAWYGSVRLRDEPKFCHRL